MAIARIPISDFTGGEAAIFPITKMPSKYSLLLQNAIITASGGIGKIPGYTRVNSVLVPESLTSGFEFRLANGGTQILCAGGGSVFKVDPATNDLVAIKTGLNVSAKVSFASMNNFCMMANGIDAPWKYNGATVTAISGTPPATVFKLHTHKNRVWALERGDKMIASYSALNAPEDWTTPNDAGYIDFKFVLSQGDELLDIQTYIDLLIFFFRNHVAIYSGSNPTGTGDFRLVQLIKGSGVVATDTTYPLGTDLLFASRSGVKSLKQVVTTGNLNTGDTSEKMDPVLMPLLNSTSTFATAYYTPLNLFFLLIDQIIWTYDVTRKAWARITGADVGGMFTTVDGDIYFCGTGRLYKFGTGWSFDGQEVDWRWDIAWLSHTKKKTFVYLKVLELVMTPGATTDIGVGVFYDFQPIVSFWNPILKANAAESMMDEPTTGLRAAAWEDPLQGFFMDADLYMAPPLSDFSKLTFKTNFGASLMDDPAVGLRAAAWEDPVDGFFMDAGSYEDVRLPLFGRGKAYSLSFQNTSTLGPIEINELRIEAEIGGN